MSGHEPSLMCYVTFVVAVLTLVMLAVTAYGALTPLRGAVWNAVPVTAFVAFVGFLSVIRGCGITTAGTLEASLWIGGSFVVGLLLGGQGQLLRSTEEQHAR